MWGGIRVGEDRERRKIGKRQGERCIWEPTKFPLSLLLPSDKRVGCAAEDSPLKAREWGWPGGLGWAEEGIEQQPRKGEATAHLRHQGVPAVDIRELLGRLELV